MLDLEEYRLFSVPIDPPSTTVAPELIEENNEGKFYTNSYVKDEVFPF